MNWKLWIFDLILLWAIFQSPTIAAPVSREGLPTREASHEDPAPRQALPTEEWSESDSLKIEEMVQTQYEQRILHIRERWMNAIPSLGSLQFAGNIGMFSLGFGWDYGKLDRWETLVQLGVLPRFDTNKTDITLTLRENFVPWSFGLGSRSLAQPKTATNTLSEQPLNWSRRSRFSVEPFFLTFALNTTFDNEFWVSEPHKYNHGDYYRFSTKMRFHLGFGSRFSFNVPREKRRHYDRISLYYDLTTYDLAVISAIPNHCIKLKDIVCLGIGVQYKFF